MPRGAACVIIVRDAMTTVFLLSPARTGGERAALLARSATPLGARLRAGEAELGDVFAWLSALYFRGKLAYARRFGRALVMAPGLGLCAPETPLSADGLAAMARIAIESDAFVAPLRRDSARLDADRVVLLGSVATGKYADTLSAALGDRLRFPVAFVGRGDMSRGGLLLRAARSGDELAYAPIAGAVRRGARPPKLPRIG